MVLSHKRVAVLTNPSAVDPSYKLVSDRLVQLQGSWNFTLTHFYAPEHGLRGDRQAGCGDDDYIDNITGLPVYSLYGVRKAPTPDQLSQADIILYDIQDVGTRFYTYIWTLTYVIEAAAKASKRVVIFDRANPNVQNVYGCRLDFDSGLVGRLLPGQNLSLPNAYGLTVGEFIRYLSPWLDTRFTQVV